MTTVENFFTSAENRGRETLLLDEKKKKRRRVARFVDTFYEVLLLLK
jgi:hypothetical protein